MAPSAHAEPTGTLTITTTSGRALADGVRLEPDELLVFEATGSGQRYLYLIEAAPGSLALIHPPVGSVLPSTEAPSRFVPQPTWLTEEDEERPGWKPEVGGAIEYVLISSPAPRDAPSDARLRSLEQLLLPPPYLAGPSAEPAVVVARRKLQREDEPEEPEDEQREGDEPEDEQRDGDEPEDEQREGDEPEDEQREGDEPEDEQREGDEPEPPDEPELK